MIHEKMVELDVLYHLLDTLREVDYKTDKNSNKLITSYWGDTYNLTNMQERANELIKEFLQPYVINSDSKE